MMETTSHDSGQSTCNSPSNSIDSAGKCTNSHNIFPRKGHKNRRGRRLDRISSLPDCVLLHILSLLPMEDAVRTGLLSRRWAYLWTYMLNLVYHDRDDPHSYEREGFIDFVNRTLVLHDGPKINTFTVDFRYEIRFGPQVDLWVRFATRKRVEELNLGLFDEKDFDSWLYGDSDQYLLPEHLYTNSSLKKLSLEFCELLPAARVCWNSLKSLSIGYSEVTDDVIRTILLGCPVLEYLKLTECQGLNHIDATSQSLRKFVLEGFWDSTFGHGNEDGDLYVLKISGPNLRSLEITGYLYSRKLRLMNVSALVDASLDFCMADDDEGDENCYEVHRNMLREILEALRYVQELAIGTWCIQVLSTWDVKSVPSPLSNRKCLTLNTTLHKWDLPGIANLLESSPDLEKLVLNTTSTDNIPFVFDRDFLVSYDFNREEFWTSQRRVFKCLLLHLKTVEILDSLTGHYGNVDLVMSLAQFLLINARVIEKMVFYKQKVEVIQLWSSPFLQKFLEVVEKLRSFPRTSPNAAVLFL